VRWRRRNGWAVLADVCAEPSVTPPPSALSEMIALGMNVRVTNTALAAKVLVVDRAALAEIPRMRLHAEDAIEFGVRVPYDLRRPR
jgi:hypothetical protein